MYQFTFEPLHFCFRIWLGFRIWTKVLTNRRICIPPFTALENCNQKLYTYVITHFCISWCICTILCLVTWPWNASEAGGDLALIETTFRTTFRLSGTQTFFLCSLSVSLSDTKGHQNLTSLIISAVWDIKTGEKRKATYSRGGTYFKFILTDKPEALILRGSLFELRH